MEAIAAKSNRLKMGRFSFTGVTVRFFAYMVDLIIVTSLCITASFLLEGDMAGVTWVSTLSTIIISWLYFAIQESSILQGTFGKRMLGLKVVGEDGEEISFKKASVRFFAKILSTLIFFIGYFMAAFNERKQALHDKLSKTYVVNRNDF